jgi:transcriptional regulator with XRE-family HTH domain
MVAEAKLKKLRDDKGWSQEYMSDILGMSQPAYSKLESGQTKLTIERATQIAKVFEVEPEYFFSTEATFVHYGKDSSYGPIQHNTNYNGNDIQKELYEKIILEKDQRIEQYQEQILFLKKELISSNGQLEKLVEKLADKF